MKVERLTQVQRGRPHHLPLIDEVCRGEVGTAVEKARLEFKLLPRVLINYNFPCLVQLRVFDSETRHFQDALPQTKRPERRRRILETVGPLHLQHQVLVVAHVTRGPWGQN